MTVLRRGQLAVGGISRVEATLFVFLVYRSMLESRITLSVAMAGLLL